MFASRTVRTAVVALSAAATVACSDDSVMGLDPVTASAPGGKNNTVTTLIAPIYSNDFSGAAGSEWSNALTSTSPSGERFLGEFGNEATTLQLNNLAAHTTVTVSLDLYIIRSWDGVDPTSGPDNFSLSADGQSLLNTTFSNMLGKHQNYPAAAGERKYVPRTGSEATNTLGFVTVAGQPLDATYRLTFTFAHSSSSLSLELAAMGLQHLGDESWGVDNVQVSIR